MAPKTDSLEYRHIATLCKYAGISFISGAVNHGMFSGERSLMTAFLGIAIYLGDLFFLCIEADAPEQNPFSPTKPTGNRTPYMTGIFSRA